MINLTLPVHNEEAVLEKKVNELVYFLRQKPYSKDLFLVLSNNGSTDATGVLCDKFAQKNEIRVIHYYIPLAGKGRAVKKAWQAYPADQYWFMDADLSTRLEHLDSLYSLLQEGANDIVIGSRLARGAKVKRSLKREFVSRGYAFWLDLLFNKQFSDAQCGFKGVNDKVVKGLLPLVRSNDFFFDTELLVLAQQKGYRIKELPVEWVEGKDSKVRLYKAIPRFFRSSFELYIRVKKD